MKQPDKNLPQNKNKAEQIKQQPKIPKDVINGILAGIGSLPAIRALGEKMKGPKVNNTESNEARTAQKEDQQKYDQRISDTQKELTSMGDSLQSYDETKADQLKKDIDSLKEFKQGRGEFMDGVIAKKAAQENEKFAKDHPEVELKNHEKQSVLDDQYLTEQFENATTLEDKAAIGAEINAQIQKSAERKAELESFIVQNKQKIIDAKEGKKQEKNDKKNEKIAEQVKLDSKIQEEFDRTMAEEAEYNKKIDRAKNINSIRKERISNEKKAEKEQEKGKKQTKKAEKSESDTIEYKRRVAELKSKNVAQEKKWDKEVETKKSKGGAFDRLKNTVGGAIKSMKEKSKANTDARNEANKENNPNYKPNQHAAKAAERMKTAYNKIKDSMKVDHEKGPIIPKKLSELKSKIDNAKINRTDKAMEEGDKVISPELIKIRSALESKQIDIESTQKEIKELTKELNSEKEGEFREVIQNHLDSQFNLLEKFENEEVELKKQGISIFESQQSSKAFQAPEVKAQIEARNIAHNKIDRLQIERDLKTKPLNAKIQKLQGNKADKSDEIKKLQAKVSKIDQDYNKLIEAQQSIIQQN
jgi:hypothetical protein